ncbi:DUF1934 domain-containing protein [Isobaculum melis]|uniref:Uncharacterized beta-barrel protein YwiB, DUF1934 family n=1 Tax=Isobaculum melis TaxID=142588 RepID=A0A1H9U2R1_9LACT|nr:DUF1934 domain-containing protein [Isobaculum melis]SES03572.1 Uncharacterized beta-barrel protein YwiB, DUF1934 family [Isobaculum melis]
MKNGQQVTLQLQTEVTQDGKTDYHQFKGVATFVKMAHSYYLRYEEEVGTMVTLKVTDESQVTILRKGQTETKLRFDLATAYPSEFVTPQGKFQLETTTQEMSVLIDEALPKGEIQVIYQLFMGEEKLGDYKLQLHFSS